MKTPLWITNAKVYPASTADSLMQLVMSHERVALETGAKIGLAVSAFELSTVSALTQTVQVVAQHVDAVELGAHTGHLTAESAVWAGAHMVILNHSEHRLGDLDTVKAHVTRAQQAGLKVVLCAENEAEVQLYAGIKPDFIAYEPPELIGSSTGSVATEKPQSIQTCADYAGDIPLLVGAGISTTDDVEVSLDMGAQGFLVASAVVKAQDPYQALTTFVRTYMG